MSIEEANRLFQQSRTLPSVSRRRCELLEEAVRLAESGGYDEASAFLLSQLESAYLLTGQLSESLATFSRCLSYVDQAPNRDVEFTQFVYKRYSEICTCAARNPTISLAEIDRMLEECRERFERAGMGPRRYLHAAWRTSLGIDRVAEAREQFRQWQAAPVDRWCYPTHIESDSVLQFLVATEQWEPLRRGAMELLAKGIPEQQGFIHLYIHGRLHEASCRTGDQQQAAADLKNYRSYCSRDGNAAKQMQPFLRHSLLMNDDTGGKVLLEQLPALQQETDFGELLQTAILAVEYLRRIQAETLELTVATAIPGVKTSAGSTRHRTEDVVNHLDRWTSELIDQFDKRNGTSRYQKTRAIWQQVGGSR